MMTTPCRRTSEIVPLSPAPPTTASALSGRKVACQTCGNEHRRVRRIQTSMRGLPGTAPGISIEPSAAPTPGPLKLTRSIAMNKKVAVILSGCGVYDGSEIYESVITLLRLDQRGVKVQCFAPNIAQMHVINHLTGEEMPESRNVLTESARLARGEIKDLREARAEDFDALIMPGGFGAAKNLSTFATEGANSKALPDVGALVKAFAEARKPVGMMCIAPTMAAEIFGAGVICTLGSDDADAAKAVGQMGASHQA